MPRYFLELGYKGTAYHGFQIQDNAPTVQLAVQNALSVLYKEEIHLTGSSRTDAGVHALQNFFHFDAELAIQEKHVYNLNAILPSDISIKSLKAVLPTAHCRFDAIGREYHYYIYTTKDPFMQDRGWYYPFELDIHSLNEIAESIKEHTDFSSFSKRNTQAYTNNCTIETSYWEQISPNQLRYTVRSNRFLRGMVRGLVGTMVKLVRTNGSINEFNNIVNAKDCTKADFSTPPQGLFLAKVIFP